MEARSSFEIALMTVYEQEESDDDDDLLQLPADTLALLQNFLSEQAASASALSVESSDQEPIDYETYLERYRPQYGLSQFWYSKVSLL